MAKNPIALAIFGISLLAFAYACILAIKTFSGGGSTEETVRISQDELDEFKNAGARQVQKEEPVKSFKRQRRIKEKQITGVWDAKLGNARGLLQMKDGGFRLILIDRTSSSLRYYINGTYTLQEDILLFNPDVRQVPPSEKYDYQILTRSEFPVMVSKHKGKMVWQEISDDVDVDVYVPNNHAVLDRAKNGIAVWSALK